MVYLAILFYNEMKEYKKFSYLQPAIRFPFKELNTVSNLKFEAVAPILLFVFCFSIEWFMVHSWLAEINSMSGNEFM